MKQLANPIRSLLLLLVMLGMTTEVNAAIIFTNDLYDAEDYTFTIDGGGTALSNITLQFGASENQSLVWDIADSRFTLSSSLRVEGNHGVIGQAYIADDHSATESDGYLNLGRTGGDWNTIAWDDANSTFRLNNTATIEGGLTVEGAVNFSNTTSLRLREVATVIGLPCTVLKEIVLHTGDNQIYVCTNTGSPGTWVAPSGGGASDFEDIYDNDTGKDLDISSGNTNFTITTGANHFVVDSAQWSVDTNGAFEAATIASIGLLNSTGGASISGGAINLNTSSNFVTNIGTGTTTAQVSLGGGANCVQVDSSTWDVSCAGVMSGLTGLSSSGPVNFSSASTYRIAESSTDPATCTAGQQYYNTTSQTIRLCVSTNTWTSAGAAGTQYVFAYDTTTQSVNTANVFQDIIYDTNGQLDGWLHTAGTGDFTTLVGGTYMINMTGRIAKSGGANTTLSFRGTVNNVEVSGSQSYGTASGSSGDTLSGNFIVTVSPGDVVRIQMTGGTGNVQIVPGGAGIVQPSTQLSIWRLK